MSGRYSIFLLLFILQSSCVLSLHCLESPYQTNHETTSNDINRILALWSRTNGTEFCHAEIIFTVGGTYNLTDCYYFGINADIEYGHATLGLNASQADNKVTLVAAPSLGHFSIFMESNLFATHVWFQGPRNASDPSNTNNNSSEGGITIWGGIGDFVKCVFDEMYNAGNGGALYVRSATVTINETIFVNNQAGVSGGALFVQTSIVDIFDSAFVQNHARWEPDFYGGGAIYVFAASSLQLRNVAFCGNWGVTGPNDIVFFPNSSYLFTCTSITPMLTTSGSYACGSLEGPSDYCNRFSMNLPPIIYPDTPPGPSSKSEGSRWYGVAVSGWVIASLLFACLCTMGAFFFMKRRRRATRTHSYVEYSRFFSGWRDTEDEDLRDEEDLLEEFRSSSEFRSATAGIQLSPPQTRE